MFTALVVAAKLKYYKDMPKKKQTAEQDGVYLLKIVMYVIFGSLWIKLGAPLHIGPLTISGIPFGLFVGLIFATHDHFQVDRKIEYTILILMAIVTYFLPAGIVI